MSTYLVVLENEKGEVVETVTQTRKASEAFDKAFNAASTRGRFVCYRKVTEHNLHRAMMAEEKLPAPAYDQMQQVKIGSSKGVIHRLIKNPEGRCWMYRVYVQVARDVWAYAHVDESQIDGLWVD